jgi:hypothetical protein
MQKKVLWSSLVILCLILIVVAFSFLFKKNPTSLCEPYLNISEISKTGNLKSCDCLKDAVQIKECQNTISNAATYTDALSQSNLSACNKIIDLGMKEACINITKAELDFVKQNVNALTTNKK